MKLSLIVPSINGKWNRLYNNLLSSCSNYNFELIGIGPKFPEAEMEDIKNFKFIHDFGCPSRSLQLSAMIAEGEYIAWCSEDSIIQDNAINECIKYADEKMSKNDMMSLRYSEGQNYSGNQDEQDWYWIAGNHNDLVLPGIKKEWRICPLFLCPLQLFFNHGGLDCRFEHINLNVHDLAFAVQNAGGTIHMSPIKVFSVNWSPDNQSESYSPVFLAYHMNDRPLLSSLYSDSNYTNNRNINIHNWRTQSPIWPRRYT